MPWELLKGKSGGVGFTDLLTKDLVSICGSKSGKKENRRIYMLKENFPKDTKQVHVMIDKEKKRIGFFTVPKGQEFSAKALSKNNKHDENKVYVSMTLKVMEELGFEKGRYEIIRKKDIENMYFYISAQKKAEKKEEVAEAKE
jgi:hypothetical protein